ncbi:unnamed protein product [Paramecium sonneborni]|uniref:Transmembrane protein n=1 Tax=Paramecium sonneborni TaxID=65129 RepID=A0A8S1RN15_9CILI|nr:unnamed protein product [Paramecium sonneborni]
MDDLFQINELVNQKQKQKICEFRIKEHQNINQEINLKWGQKVVIFLESFNDMIFMTIVTVYALFRDDLRVLFGAIIQKVYYIRQILNNKSNLFEHIFYRGCFSAFILQEVRLVRLQKLHKQAIQFLEKQQKNYQHKK